jgi:hypothetical protein
MAISGVSAAAAGASASSQAASQSVAQHKHGRHHASIADVDAQSSSAGSAASPTGKVGSKVDISV